MLKKYVLLVIFLSIISINSSLKFIPDETNPLQMIKPTSKEQNTKIILKFKFPNNSKGLLNKQVIGISFPKIIGVNDSLFDLYTVENNFRYGCELYYDNILIKTSPVIYSPSTINFVTENNIAYCQIDDPYNAPLLPNSNKSIIFTIYLNQITITSLSFIRNLELFTSTSANADKIYIDSYNNFGSLTIYGDPISPPALEITNAVASVTKGPISNKIYILNTFDIILTIKVNNFVSFRDSVFVIKYPNDAVTAPNSISSSANDPSNPSQLALKSENDSLSLSTMTLDSVSIQGIKEDLVSGRQFKLTIKNFTATNTKSVNKNIELIVYYLNSYSQISYSTNPIFNISLVDLNNVSIGHPETDKVYSGHAYPFDFTFSLNTDINLPTLITFQHSHALDSATNIGGAKLNFLAATCDFTSNGSFNTYFGQRPKCYPMRLDFNYPNASSVVDYLGSGIVFKVNNLVANLNYKVRVWIVFDECGTTNNPLVLENSDNKLNPYVEFKFNIKIQQFIKSDKIRLNYDIGTAYADLQDIVSKTPCWQSSKNEIYTTDDKGATSPAGDWQSSEISDTASNGILLVKEINNFDLLKSYNQEINNLVPNQNIFNSIYLNNANQDFSTNPNYFYIKSDFKLYKDEMIYRYFPFNLSYKVNQKTFDTLPIKGNLEFRLSRPWLKTGNYEPNQKACWVSWGFRGEQSPIKNLELYPEQDTSLNLKTKKNLIYIGKEVSASSTVNLSNLILPNSSGADMIRIASKFVESPVPINNPDFTINYNYKATGISENASFNLYSNCVAINENMPLVKSIYHYFEGYINWIYSKSEIDRKYTIRVIRFLKLFPSIGFFNDLSSQNRISLSSVDNLFKFHYVNVKNQEVNSICILEISADTIKNFQDKIDQNNQNNFIFQMNLYNLNLLETDYENIAINYPIMQSFKDETDPQYVEIISDYYQSSITLNNTNKSYLSTLNIDSNSYYNGENNNKMINYAYMSANIRILNLKNIANTYKTNNKNNILIPTSCPIRKITESSNYKYFTLPVITSFLYSYDNFGTINKNFIYATLNASSDTTRNIFLLPTVKKYISHKVQYATLRFSRYTLTNIINLNILFGTNFAQSQYTSGLGKVYCSAMNILLNSEIDLNKENINFNFKSVAIPKENIFYSINKNYLNSNYFYLNKIGFNKLLIGISSTSITTTDQNDNNTSAFPTNAGYIIQGVKRPTIETYIVNLNNQINFSFVDKIGFACSSINDNNDSEYYSTNFVVFKDQNNNVSNFILDIDKDNIENWKYTLKDDTKNSQISLDDNNTTLFTNEVTGNFKLNLFLPKPAPNGSFLKLESSNNFNRNTLCGIFNTLKNNLVNDCFVKDNLYSKIYCPIYSKTKNDIPNNIYDNFMDPNIYLNICCYNININTKISLSNLEVYLNLDSSVKGLTNFLSMSFLQDNSSVKELNINSQILQSLNKLDPVKINSISFIYANHEGALSKMKINIIFPREIIRNSKIIISSSAFSNLLIPNTKQECFILNIDGNNKIEPFVESCIINFTDSSRTIIIKFKKIIYTCGIKLPNSFFILLSPVKIIDFYNLNFKINWFMNDNGENITNMDIIQIFPNINTDINLIKKKPYLADKWGSLCNIIKVFPRLVSEYSYYDFDLNILLLNNIQDKININEFSIFFPSNLYSDEHLSILYCEVINFPNILCSCQLEEKGIVTVKFSENIFNEIENVRVRITGIQNPGIENEIIAFPCSLNYMSNNKSDSNYNSRYNVLTGSGFLKGGLNNSISLLGNIRLFNNQNFISDTNPRIKGSYILKLAFDFSSRITLPLTITYNPVLIINFPEQYSLYKYAYSTSFSDVSITASIEEVIQGDNNVQTSNGYLSISNISVLNNSIQIYLNESTRIIPQNFRFWQIKLNYVPGPSESVLTGTFGLTLTNIPNNIYIKTFSNSDTLITDLNNNKVDPFFPYFRGINFYFDNIKIILDVVDNQDVNNNPNNLNNSNNNQILLKPGFFKDIIIQARIITKSMKSYITQITLKDSKFITDKSSYQFSTSNPILKLKIGVPCNTLKGIYYINFQISNNVDFLEMSPVTVLVGDIEPSTISLDTITNIPLGSSQMITYSLLEKNVDILNIVWNPDPNNDSSAQIEAISIESGDENPSVFFSIANINTNSTQIFTSTDPNSCFKLFTKNLSFKFDSNFADLTPFIKDPEKFKSQFYLFNYDDYNLIPANSIKIVFKPIIFPIYLFCAIVCHDSDFPSDDSILAGDNQNWSFQKYIYSDKKLEFNFTNLMKNTRYKIKCIVQTTQSQLKQRTQLIIEILKFNQKEDSGFFNLKDISTTKMPPTNCLQFRFQKRLGNIVRDALINYCQNFYKSYNGCIICLDNTKRNSLGINPGTYYGCNIGEGNKNIQIIDENNIIDGPLFQKDSNNAEISIFTMCPIQDLFCPTSLSNEDYNKSTYTLLQNISSDSMISINVRLPFLQLQEIKVLSDLDIPDINNMSLNINSYNEMGFYSFTVSNPKQVYCYYAIFMTNTLFTPIEDDVIKCNDPSRCGKARINSVSSIISISTNDMRIFQNGNYSIWFICLNDIPNPVRRSTVQKKGNFDILAYKQPINKSNANYIQSGFEYIFIWFLLIILF